MLYFALRQSNEYDLVEEVVEKRKKHVKLTQKYQWKPCSTTLLHFVFPRNVSLWNKAY